MKVPQIKGTLRFSRNGVRAAMPFGAEGSTRVEGIAIEPSITETAHGIRFDLRVHTQSEIVIDAAFFETDLIDTRNDRVYLNGYQSWTDTKEFTRHDRMTGPSKLLAPLFEKHKVQRYGDYDFQGYSRRRGVLHGASYAYVRGGGDTVRLIGSLDETSGFTFIKVNLNKKRMAVGKDCTGLAVTGEYRAFSLLFAEGTLDGVMDRWFAEMNIKPLPALPRTGWTSWYNYYQDISEEIILDNLDSFTERKIPIEVFQIDDGYQTAVGDWLSVNDRFPNGLKPIADRIKEAGFIPGIWLAPFAGETKSALFTEHPDWFISDDEGRPFCTGGNWSAFYALDLYNDEARSYIRHVFDVILNDWGFELVKLDFLYGVCIKPRRDKTRGQIMCEAMDFLRECVGEKQIIGCGVPLWPAFGKVEYCRIGTDIDLQWHNRLYGLLIHREFPSTKNAVQNSVFRRHLDGRAFVNDPDVFLLRHSHAGRQGNITLTEGQKKIVFYINNIFGNLLFTSDNIREYTPAERNRYLSSFPLSGKKIRSVSVDGELYTARFSIGEREYFFASNNGTKPRRTKLPDSLCFRALSRPPCWFAPESTLALAPFTAECFLLCDGGTPWKVIGSTVSAFPGSEVTGVSGNGEALILELAETVRAEGEIYVSVPENAGRVQFDKTILPVSELTVADRRLRYTVIHIKSLYKGT